MRKRNVRAPTVYFQKPAPLSPNGRAQLGADGRFYVKRNGRLRLSKGVPANQSIYYWWWCFLRASWKYQLACGHAVTLNARQRAEYDCWWGSVGQKLSSDFGDIFNTDFWNWWSNRERTSRGRGAELFGVMISESLPDRFVDYETIKMHQQEIIDDDVRVILIPRMLTKKTLRSKVGFLISNLEHEWLEPKCPRYSVRNLKVRSNTLQEAYQAWQGKLLGLSHIEIAAQIKYPKRLAAELAMDRRTTGFTYRALDAVEEKKLNRVLGTGATRTRMKNILNVQAARLIRMAEANIRGAEQGEFPVSLNEALNSD